MSRYSFQGGLPAFRHSIAAYMSSRFGVEVNPASELVPLIGSKEGLVNLALGVLNPGDICILPDPGYPAYVGGAVYSGAGIELYPLQKEENFLVDLKKLSDETLRKARLVYLNYPNNPTGAIAPRDYLEHTVEICRENEIVLAYDNPYCEIGFDGYRAPSILEIPGARDVAIEFHSFSKSYAMTGWRLGWAAGGSDLISTLTRTKTYVDTGPFLAVQKAGSAVLDRYEECCEPVRAALEERRNALVTGLNDAGCEVVAPKAAMYLWIPLPEGVIAEDFCRRLLEREALVALAGTTFGESASDYCRLALTVELSRLREAAERFARELHNL